MLNDGISMNLKILRRRIVKVDRHSVIDRGSECDGSRQRYLRRLRYHVYVGQLIVEVRRLKRAGTEDRQRTLGHQKASLAVRALGRLQQRNVHAGRRTVRTERRVRRILIGDRIVAMHRQPVRRQILHAHRRRELQKILMRWRCLLRIVRRIAIRKFSQPIVEVIRAEQLFSSARSNNQLLLQQIDIDVL